MLILLVVILFLFADKQLNLHNEEQQKMEAELLDNNARDMKEDSLKLQKIEAGKIAHYIRAWKEFEEHLLDQFYSVSTP